MLPLSVQQKFKEH